MAYSLGPVKPWVLAAANELGPRFGIKTVGGYRAIATADDHPAGHHDGLALDFMTSDVSTGTALAEYAKSNANRLGVYYIIWRQHIWDVLRSSEGWRLMPDRGSATANHMNHVHVSFREVAPPGFTGSTQPGQKWTTRVGGSGDASSDATDDGSSSSSQDSGSGSSNATNAGFSLGEVTDGIRTLAIFGAVLLGGVALIAVGTAAISKPKATAAASAVASSVPPEAALAL
jgi:hypothetical protein